MANALNCRVHTVARLKNGMKVKVVWNDLLRLEIVKTGIHNARNVELLSNLLAFGMIFFDIGAHVGQYSLIASRIVGGHWEVHSFGPDPETFQCLTDNIAMNGLTNVRPNRVALSDQDGTKTFYLS
jgi:predicted RNA methylase